MKYHYNLYNKILNGYKPNPAENRILRTKAYLKMNFKNRFNKIARTKYKHVSNKTRTATKFKY